MSKTLEEMVSNVQKMEQKFSSLKDLESNTKSTKMFLENKRASLIKESQALEESLKEFGLDPNSGDLTESLSDMYENLEKEYKKMVISIQGNDKIVSDIKAKLDE